MSDFETVREQTDLKSFCDTHLQARGKSYVCPLCGSGSHANKTPALSIRGKRWKCFACDQGGDIFDLQGALLKTDDKRAQLEAVASWARIPIAQQSQPLKKSENASFVTPEKRQSPNPDYKAGRDSEWAFILESQRHISEAMDYVTRRGFTEGEAQAFGFGYDPKGKRLVIPWIGSAFYHTDRDITNTSERKYLKPSSEKVGSQPLFNPQALESEAVFITEGALDAFAIKALGFEAIATGGAGYSAVASAIATKGYRGVLIPFMDNDETGRKLNDGLTEALESQRLTVYRPNLEEMGVKDACELLETNRDALRAFLSRVHGQAVQTAEEMKERAYNAALASLRVQSPIDIATEIFSLENEPVYTPTGFNSLDSKLNGGLSNGLIVLGALSSLGKTTLCVQICDAVASQGRSVLFASIEQSGREIVAKSLSRYMSYEGYTCSTTELQSSKYRLSWAEEKTLAFVRACERYSQEVAPRLSILEAIKRPTVNDIRTATQLIADRDGQAPLVCVDYLQLLAPESDRLSTREAVEGNVTALRQMAIHELKAPIIAISSINRGSYANGVTLDAFKETGNIEFSSDVCLGLQPRGMNELETPSGGETQSKRAADKFIRREKGKLERPCELFILKNRNAPTPESGIPLTFKTIESRFVEE